MDNKPTNISQSLQSREICTHMSKVSKKNIQSLQNYNYVPICKGCQISLNPSRMRIGINKIEINICLHCGQLFCSKKQCVENHQKESHLFWISLELSDQPPSLLIQHSQQQKCKNKFKIHCKLCGDLEEQTKIVIANQNQQRKAKILQGVSKLKRFTQFVYQSLSKSLPLVIIDNFNDFIQLYSQCEPNIFGLRNLGNTCFLNTVLQILYYTQPFNLIYTHFANKTNMPWNQMISRQKSKRRQMEYFYDNCIEKNQSQSWHIVGDKRAKAKDRQFRKDLQKFVPSGFVRDSKFNLIFNKFITNIKKFMEQSQKCKIKQKIVYQPIQILSNLSQFDKKYQLKMQQDAQQLLILIIDVLSQGEMISMLGNSEDRKERYIKVQKILGRQKLSPLQQIFGSYLSSHVICLGCKRQNWTIDFTYHLPVSLNDHHKQQKSLQGDINAPIEGIPYYRQLYYPQSMNKDCKILESLFKAERLTNKENYYMCQKCQSLSAIKQFYLIDPPEILIISFKRFEHNKKSKINTYVKFQQGIDISKFLLRQKDQNQQISVIDTNYELYGVIVHKGETISSGHYICFIKIKQQNQNPSKSIWYEFSDDKMKKVTSKQVFKQQAYILFYNSVKKSY